MKQKIIVFKKKIIEKFIDSESPIRDDSALIFRTFLMLYYGMMNITGIILFAARISSNVMCRRLNSLRRLGAKPISFPSI
jgi:hypothetical protein